MNKKLRKWLGGAKRRETKKSSTAASSTEQQSVTSSRGLGGGESDVRSLPESLATGVSFGPESRGEQRSVTSRRSGAAVSLSGVSLREREDGVSSFVRENNFLVERFLVQVARSTLCVCSDAKANHIAKIQYGCVSHGLFFTW